MAGIPQLIGTGVSVWVMVLSLMFLEKFASTVALRAQRTATYEKNNNLQTDNIINQLDNTCTAFRKWCIWENTTKYTNTACRPDENGSCFRVY